MSTKIVETKHGHIEMPDHYDPEQITEVDLQNDTCLRIVAEDALGLTDIEVERGDDFAGEFEDDDQFSDFCDLYDAAEQAELEREFPGTNVFVRVHRNTSGFRTRISWIEDGIREEDADSVIAERVRAAMYRASGAAWLEMEKGQG